MAGPRPTGWHARAAAMLEVTRPATSLTAALLAIAGARLGATSDAPEIGTLAVLGLAVGWFLLAQASFAINDAFDAPIDAVVHRYRPIPSGRLGRHQAGVLGLALVLAGSAILAIVAAPLGPVGLAYGAANWLYSAQVKMRDGLLANVMTAGLVAVVPVSTWATGASVAALAWVVVAIVLGVLAREILNDIEDDVGDRVLGRPTLPLRLGRPVAFRVSAALWCAFVAAVWAPGALSSRVSEAPYLAVMLPLSAASLAVAVAMASRRAGLLPRLQLATKLILAAFAVAAIVAPHWYR